MGIAKTIMEALGLLKPAWRLEREVAEGLGWPRSLREHGVMSWGFPDAGGATWQATMAWEHGSIEAFSSDGPRTVSLRWAIEGQKATPERFEMNGEAVSERKALKHWLATIGKSRREPIFRRISSGP